MIKNKADLHAQDKKKNRTPLHLTVLYKNNIPVVKLLLVKEANVNAKNVPLLTHLHYAMMTRTNNRDIIKLLCEQTLKVMQKIKT